MSAYLKYLPTPILICLVARETIHIKQTLNKLGPQQIMCIIVLHVHVILVIVTLDVEIGDFRREECRLQSVRLIARVQQIFRQPHMTGGHPVMNTQCQCAW